MKLTTILYSILISFLVFDNHKSSESVLIKDIAYVDGIYYHNDRIFNGDIIDYYENETLKFRYAVLDGRLHGLAKEFYPSGKVKSERNYIVSKLYGQFTEYFESGEIMAQFDVKLNAYGQGEIINQVVIGELKNGKYKSKSYSEGIIYFVSAKGDTYSNSEQISILNQTNYRITDKDKKKTLIEVK
uniref:toxin-antitoxin system YwqK family antitoxin n=1 Tax=Roseivirga sp. TaxID=1964215 RepID=UPI0040479B42